MMELPCVVGAGLRHEVGPGEAPDAGADLGVRVIGPGSAALGQAAPFPAGVALAIPADPEQDALAILMLDAAGSTLMRVGGFEDAEAVAVWRALGSSTGLPLMIRRGDGVVERPF